MHRRFSPDFDLDGDRLASQTPFDAEQVVTASDDPLFTAVNTLATYFGGSVVIENMNRTIITYSTVDGQEIDEVRAEGILSRQVPEDPANDGQYRKVLSSESAVRFAAEPHVKARIAMAIRAGHYPLGTLWIVDSSPETQLTKDQENILHAMAALVSTTLMQRIHNEQAVGHSREAILRSLLEGGRTHDKQWRQLGFHRTTTVGYLGVRIRTQTPLDEAHRTHTVIRRHILTFHPDAQTVVTPASVAALIPIDHAETFPQAVQPLTSVLLRVLGDDIVIVLPGTTQDRSKLPQLQRVAEHLYDLSNVDGSLAKSHSNVMSLSDHRTELLIDEVRSTLSRLDYLNDPELTEMCAKTPRTAMTLLAWYENFGNVTKTALALGVHENTVRYRLQHVEKQFREFGRDPDRMLYTWLQLASMRHLFS